jgi:hypothetical protein
MLFCPREAQVSGTSRTQRCRLAVLFSLAAVAILAIPGLARAESRVSAARAVAADSADARNVAVGPRRRVSQAKPGHHGRRHHAPRRVVPTSPGSPGHPTSPTTPTGPTAPPTGPTTPPSTPPAGGLVPPPSGSSATPPAVCTSTVTSVAAAQSALSSAAAGQVVCLADGTYGEVTLSTSKAAPGVTLQSANPGGATIGSVQVNGSGYTIARFVINGGVTIARNVDRTVVDHNHILGGNHFGVFVCTAEPPDQCDDTAITNNVFDGAMNEDQIRANVYHDANGDGIGLLVEGNEFQGNTERGGHNDTFQSVWVGDHLVFRKNYLHDFGGQGFFVKDQSPAINGFIADDNLIVRQDLPCEPASLCSGYQLSPWQVYGPISNGEMNHNTFAWGGGGGTAVLTGSYTNMQVSSNVFSTITLTNGGGSIPTMSGTDNTYCDSGGSSPPPGSTRECNPPFLNPAADDYRLASGRGVDWAPAEMHYGP